MRITTSCNWLLACLLTQGFLLDVVVAADTQPSPPTTPPIHTRPIHASSPVSSSQLTLPDEGPRYDHIVEGPDSLQFQEAVAAFKHGQYAMARAGFVALVKHDPDSVLVPPTKAFLAELTLLEDPTGHGRSEAITQYRTLIRLYPKDPNTSRALWRIGDLYVEMGWLQEAIVAYEYAASRVLTRADTDRSMLVSE